jgi:hypothetical protein
MHPVDMYRIVSEHNERLRTQAYRARLHVQPAGPRNSVRHRAGWTLVEIGLRLAGASDDG